LGERLNGIQEVVSSILIGSTNPRNFPRNGGRKAAVGVSGRHRSARMMMAMSGTIVYLDICALKRPFDDGRQERIRREAEAVARIFEQVENGSVQLVASPAHRFENDRNPREDRRLATDLWLQKATHTVETTPAIDERVRLLAGLGFGPLDALHLAFAEQAEARWFVTTDDRLLRKALEQRDDMQVEVVRPDQLALDQEHQS
jgi:predicted nucleic acid-binding protein